MQGGAPKIFAHHAVKLFEQQNSLAKACNKIRFIMFLTS